MRLAFAGTPEFARCALDALLAAGHELCCVLTQPDRPAGRGQRLQSSAVKQAAQAAGIPVLQPRSLRLDGKYPAEAASARAALLAHAPELMVVVAYGLLLPQWVLDLPPLGCLNIHASLLPRWRGAAPIQRAIEAGDARTGISIMQMDAGLDTGAVLQSSARPIGAQDTAASLHDALAGDGARDIVRVLELIESGQAPQAQPQPEDGVSYAAKLLKSEAALDFSQSADVLQRRIRAFNPFPGCSFEHPEMGLIKVWAATVLEEHGAPAAAGSILASGKAGMDIACGQGVLRITQIQKPGGRRQDLGA